MTIHTTCDACEFRDWHHQIFVEIINRIFLRYHIFGYKNSFDKLGGNIIWLVILGVAKIVLTMYYKYAIIWTIIYFCLKRND